MVGRWRSQVFLVATGTSGGLLEDSNRHAQSVFKHEILRQYMLPFVAMLGSYSTGKRVVVLDGFAGRGRYADGSPASAELILQAVESLRQSRQVSAFFVEKSAKDYRALSGVVDEYVARGLQAKAWPGAVEDRLDAVVEAASGVPLFLFLDPCGANLPFARLAAVLAGSRRHDRPQTELLLNFSADLSRRAAGALKAGQASHPIISLMDQTCGGAWWRDTVLTALSSPTTRNFEPAAAAVAQEYAQQLARAGSMLHVTVPVRRRMHHQPIYHLVFLTRSPYGLWVFADALGKARQAWLRALGTVDDEDTGGMLFTPADDMGWLIEAEETRAERAIIQNLRVLAGRLNRFKLVEHALDIYGEEYGVATDSCISAALKTLKGSGDLIVYQNASRLRDRVVGPGPNLQPTRR
jgi:three-Cys-motif partner protein